MELSAAELAALTAAAARDVALEGDRARRKRDGIVHTPPELARFCARAVDDLLRGELGVARGLADAAVHVVDPACGPGAFLAAALHVASAHGRVQATLTGVDRDEAALQSAREVLAGAPVPGVSLLLADTLRDETLLSRLRAQAQTLVVLGNPPWAVQAASADASAHMQRMLADFHVDAEGASLQEKKLGVLSDLYVRFFRWALELARGARAGAVVALVTNGSFLDGPVQRGMRAQLMQAFDEVHVVDLGGNALVGRPRGASVRDDNVFGVRPGVAITFLVRRASSSGATGVRYTRVFGSAAQKREALADARLDTLQVQRLAPAAPSWRWVPAPPQSLHYAQFLSLSECMPFHREGVQSNRDALVVAASREELMQRLRGFAGQGGALGDELRRLAENALPHYDPNAARATVRRALEADPDGSRGISARRIAYRPFDERWFTPVAPLCHRPRPELLRAFEYAPLALVAVRKDRGTAPYAHFAASTSPIDNCFLSARSSCRARAFPVRDADGRDNLAQGPRDLLSEVAGKAIDADAFVRYALCVLASTTYRARFEGELRVDYPRIPVPTQPEQLAACVRAGDALLRVLTSPPVARGEVRAVEPSEAARALVIGHHPVWKNASTSLRDGGLAERLEAAVDALHACERAGAALLASVAPVSR